MEKVAAEPLKFAYESMGTRWEISVWDSLEAGIFEELKVEILRQSREFDETYSRFIKSSFVSSIAARSGVIEVPADFIKMLKMYQKFNALSGGKVNPLIGNTLSDMGYDADYSLQPRGEIRPTPGLDETVKILDERRSQSDCLPGHPPQRVGRISVAEPVLFDFGALGKGFFVDKISDFLIQKNVLRFLVNGSGDIFYHGDGVAMNAGLEHPSDPTKVIGVVPMLEGAMCASGTNRRRWSQYHHIIDPQTKSSPEEILAVWVLASTAAVADGLATCLFLCDPENFQKEFAFEYCILNREMKVKRSAGFKAELF